MKRAVLFVNGEIKEYPWHQSLLLPADDLIAVDGGGRHCLAMGLVPHLAVGDFDSLPTVVKEFYLANGVPLRGFPSEKDVTDFILGIEAALEREAGEILFLGALGGPRTDMMLANLLALAPFHGRAKLMLVSETSWITTAGPEEVLDIAGAAGDYVSLLPLSPLLRTGPSRGLKYPLAGLSFPFGSTLGLSNELTGAAAEITVIEGLAAVICCHLPGRR